jgi:CubicO group peptidase (beta-lactamase class C family)
MTRARSLLLAAAALLPAALRAQQPAPTPAPVPAESPNVSPAVPVPATASAPSRGLRDRAELEGFLDGVMAANLRDKHVAGATVAVVKDGQLFFAKGYGWSNVDKREPVAGDRTLFRIGSISKLFTWTSVMQLAEQGKLDLDKDVNTYLDFKIPATYPQPITLRHILAHTAGFEENGRDLISDDSAHVMPLRDWLTQRMPARVRPPGVYSAYSNYATALAGYIVQRVSGQSYDDYVDQHILQPLGMTHASTREPLPARLRPDMSVGYTWGGGHFQGHPFERIDAAAPAGSVSATATDMARFMIAHLGNGALPAELGGGRILAESTAVKMHTRSFSHDPRLNGWALGFYEKSSHGVRIIGHGGDTRWFHSDLALIPDDHIGVFVSYNTATGGELSFGPFLNEFLDHYYPTPAPPVALGPDKVEQARRVAGEYAFNRRSFTTFQAAFGLAGDVTVAAADSGRVLMHSALGDVRLVPVGPMLYRDELGGDLVSFKAEGNGPATLGFLGFAPMMVMERVPWYASVKLHWTVLGLGVLVFLMTVLAAAARFVRRRFGTPRPEDALPGRWLVVGLALLYLVFIVSAGVVLGSSGGLLTGPLTGLRVAFTLPVIAVLLTLGAAFAAVNQWRSGAGTRAARMRYGATVALALLFAWSLNVWNLLGWRL